MRLVHINDSGELSLVGPFFDDNPPPPYAILSHRWRPGEVTFEKFSQRSFEEEPGYKKLLFCAGRAYSDGLAHFWVDTCCINEKSSAELTEAINKMFRYYKNSAKCYVYLHDVSSRKNDSSSAFVKSEWFERGWTLQELLAPTSVEFFSKEHEFLGDRRTLGDRIHQATGIHISALQGEPLDSFTVDERLRWAAYRKTSREEDKWYSLFGIFDVCLPVIYGEGRARAEARLLKEVIGMSLASSVSSLVPDSPTEQDADSSVRAKHKPNLLSLDGGGVKGLSSLFALKVLMEAIDPDSPPRPCEVFDLIGGTGTGGLIAVMLGRLGMSVDECIEQYVELVRRIFALERTSGIDGRRLHVSRLELDPTKLDVAMKDILKKFRRSQDERLLEKPNSHCRFGVSNSDREKPKSSCRVFVTSASVKNGETVRFASYTMRQAPSRSLRQAMIWEVCRATCAVEDIFPSIKIGAFNEEFMNGKTNTSNPVNMVWDEGRSLWEESNSQPFRENLGCLVSIGAGLSSGEPVGSSTGSLLESLRRIGKETQQEADSFIREQEKKDLFREKRYFRMNLTPVSNSEREEWGRTDEFDSATTKYFERPTNELALKDCAYRLRDKVATTAERRRLQAAELLDRSQLEINEWMKDLKKQSSTNRWERRPEHENEMTERTSRVNAGLSKLRQSLHEVQELQKDGDKRLEEVEKKNAVRKQKKKDLKLEKRKQEERIYQLRLENEMLRRTNVERDEEINGLRNELRTQYQQIIQDLAMLSSQHQYLRKEKLYWKSFVEKAKALAASIWETITETDIQLRQILHPQTGESKSSTRKTITETEQVRRIDNSLKLCSAHHRGSSFNCYAVLCIVIGLVAVGIVNA